MASTNWRRDAEGYANPAAPQVNRFFKTPRALRSVVDPTSLAGDKIELERLLRSTQGISAPLEAVLVNGSGGGEPRPTGDDAMLNIELLEAPVLVTTQHEAKVFGASLGLVADGYA